MREAPTMMPWNARLHAAEDLVPLGAVCDAALAGELGVLQHPPGMRLCIRLRQQPVVGIELLCEN